MFAISLIAAINISAKLSMIYLVVIPLLGAGIAFIILKTYNKENNLDLRFEKIIKEAMYE